MKRRTHLLFGLGSTVFFFSSMTQSLPELFFVGLLGSLFPDLDVRFKHRVLLHNVFSMVMFFILVCIFMIHLGNYYEESMYIALAGTYAYSTHLLLDSFTYKGISLVWPLKKKWYGPRRVGFDDSTVNAFFSIVGFLLLLLAITRRLGL